MNSEFSTGIFENYAANLLILFPLKNTIVLWYIPEHRLHSKIPTES